MEDCRFYYGSGCGRGSSCKFRHEPLAIGREQVCRYFLRSGCTRKRCAFRHTFDAVSISSIFILKIMLFIQMVYILVNTIINVSDFIDALLDNISLLICLE